MQSASSIPVAVQTVRRRNKKMGGFLLALPAMFWLGLFFVLPLFIVLGISLMTRGERNTIVLPLTLEHYEYVFGRVYFPVLLRSLRIAFATTLICLVIGYPLAFFISTRQREWVKNTALFLVVLPFWTNFLVRTYAIQTLIGTEGVINGMLQSAGIIQEPLQMMLTEGAVLLGLVYGFLPFMILPIYASAERFDWRLVEAAHDLGANDWWAFIRIVVPLTLPGVIAGCILVFIPAIGAFVTPELLGGTKGTMIGSLIADAYGGAGNWPRSSAASIVLMGMVLLSLLIYVRYARER